MYVNNFDDGHVEVEYILAHTGHALSHDELKHLPSPASSGNKIKPWYKSFSYLKKMVRNNEAI